MVVYDVTSSESLRSTTKWIMSVRSTRPSGPQIIGCLVGNKADLRDGTLSRAEVSHDDASRLAIDLGLISFEVSASANTEVDAPFIHIAKEFYKRSVKILISISSSTGLLFRDGFEGNDSNEPATLRAGLVSCIPPCCPFTRWNDPVPVPLLEKSYVSYFFRVGGGGRPFRHPPSLISPLVSPLVSPLLFQVP